MLWCWAPRPSGGTWWSRRTTSPSTCHTTTLSSRAGVSPASHCYCWSILVSQQQQQWPHEWLDNIAIVIILISYVLLCHRIIIFPIIPPPFSSHFSRTFYTLFFTQMSTEKWVILSSPNPISYQTFGPYSHRHTQFCKLLYVYNSSHYSLSLTLLNTRTSSNIQFWVLMSTC